MKQPRLAHLAAQARIASPLGPLVLAASPRGLAGVWMDAQAHHPGALGVPEDARHPHLAQAARELERWWAGDVRPFAVPLDPAGTPFQQAVWRALLAIAPGATSTYGAIALAVGKPAAVRAVGAAVGRNPLGIVVPCHRVVGHDGGLTGYAGGLPNKRWLLDHEHRHAGRVMPLAFDAMPEAV